MVAYRIPRGNDTSLALFRQSVRQDVVHHQTLNALSSVDREDSHARLSHGRSVPSTVVNAAMVVVKLLPFSFGSDEYFH